MSPLGEASVRPPLYLRLGLASRSRAPQRCLSAAARFMAVMNSRLTERERPRLLVERSVLGHRLPSASRRKSSSSRSHETSQRAGVCLFWLSAAGSGS